MWCSSTESYQSDGGTLADSSVSNCEEKVAVAVNKSVTVHDRETLREIIQLNFDSEVNCICWADSVGSFLLVAEHSGLLHTVHTKSQRVINSEKVYQSYNDVSKTFLQLLVVEESKLVIILGSDHMVHGFMNMDYAALDRALCEGALQKAVALRQHIVHTTVQSPHGAQYILPDVYLGHISLIALGGEEDSLSRIDYDRISSSWSIEAQTSLYGYGDQVKGIKLSPQYLLTLTSQGCLVLWSILTYTAVKVWTNQNITDVAALRLSDDKLSDCEIIVSTSECISVLSLPTLDTVYTIHTTNALLAHSYSGLLMVHYLTEEGPGAPPKLTYISMISSKARYDMMIKRQQYDEALMFAKKHSLDTQLVYEAKACRISQDITVSTAAEFRSCLDELTDIHRVVDLCIQSRSAVGDIMSRVLKYSLLRLQKAGQHSKSSQGDRMKEVLRRLQMFHTYSEAFGSNLYTLDSWLIFLQCDLSAEVLRLAKSQSITAAMIIWSRHKAELLPTLTAQWLDDLLTCLSTSLDCDTVTGWLSEHLVHAVDRLENPELSEMLAKHMERLARDYELSNKTDWPDNSLRLCSVADGIRSALLTPTLARLRLLRTNLQNIKDLKDTYQCYLSYTQYCEQTRESIVYRLLDVVAVPSMFRQHYESIASLYMSKYCISSDKNLLSYVQDLIERYQYIRGYDSTGLLWEQKAVEVVMCINQPSYRLQAVTALAKHCQTPWSKCIAQMVDQTCDLLQHQENISELRDIQKRSVLSHLLSTYNIPREVIPTPRNAIMIIKYILRKSDHSLSGLQHALQVGQALMVDDTAVYLAACQGRLSTFTDLADIIPIIPDDIRCHVITRLVSQCVELLTQSGTIDHKLGQHWADVTVSLINNHRSSIDSSYFHTPITLLGQQIKAIITLKNEYGIDISLMNLSETSTCKNHLIQIIEVILDESKAGDQPDDDQSDAVIKGINKQLWRLVRFGQLTHISAGEVNNIVIWTVSKSCLAAIPQLLRVIASHDDSVETADSVFRQLRWAVTQQVGNVKNAKLLYKLSSYCVTRVSPDLLLDAANLHSYLHFHCDLMSNCLGGGDCDMEDLSESGDGRAELEQLFTRKYYNEKDLLVNTKATSKLVNSVLHGIIATKSPMCDVMDSMEHHESFTDLLSNNSHDLLLIRLSLLLYYSPNSLTAYTDQHCITMRNQMSSTLKGCVARILTRLMSQRNLDVQLTLASLLDLPASTGLSLIKKNAASFGSQFIRILALTNVALVLCSTHKQEEYKKKCMVLKQDSIWGYILSKYGVNFLPVFGKISKSQLLSKIATKCPLQVIDKYISDYSMSLDRELTYLTRIQHLSEKHSQSRFWSHDSPSSVTMDIETILTEIQILLDAIPNIDQQIVNSLLEGCNPYNYSLLRLLLSKCGDGANKRMKLLDFLTLYKRHAAPSKWELDFVKQLCGDNAQYEEISKIRLPYQTLTSGSVWKTIKAELNVNTFRILQPIASLLDIQTDVFLLNTAVQIAESHIGKLTSSHSSNSTNWCNDEQINNKFFDDIMTVLAAIKDRKSAVMCCQSLVDKVPHGVERVLVTKICLDLAINWKQALNQEKEDMMTADAVVRKLTAMYMMLAVEQVLHEHKLASDDHIEIIEHPTRLIQCILESTHDDSSERANEKFDACCKVADLTGRDIRNICYDILTSWLNLGSQNAQSNVDMDMTMTIDMGSMMSAALQEPTNQSEADTDNKEKWIVNLASSKIGDKIVHLLNSSLNSLASCNKTKLLVVKCFLLLGDASLANLSNKKSPSQFIQLTNQELSRQYKALKYINRLQALNINMTVEEFYSCDLSALIVRLNKNYSTNSSAVVLCADLCIETSNYEIVMWRSLLLQLIQLNEIDKLCEVLMVTCYQTQLWSLDVYRQAWQIIYQKSSSKDTVYKTAMKSCPILDMIKK